MSVVLYLLAPNQTYTDHLIQSEALADAGYEATDSNWQYETFRPIHGRARHRFPANERARMYVAEGYQVVFTNTYLESTQLQGMVKLWKRHPSAEFPHAESGIEFLVDAYEWENDMIRTLKDFLNSLEHKSFDSTA